MKKLKDVVITVAKVVITVAKDIIMHPLKNISFYFIVLIAIFISLFDIKKMSGIEMLGFSCGLITILNLMIVYLKSHTLDNDKKENYYLGYNLKKRSIHNNFWYKHFGNICLRLYLWFLVIFPAIAIMLEHIDIEGIKCHIDNIIYIVWLSIFLVICFYFAAILIESVYIAKKEFLNSNFYKLDDWYNKKQIEKRLKEDSILYFGKLLKIKKFNSKGNKQGVVLVSESSTNSIFKVARSVTKSEKEFIQFIDIVYSAERTVIENIICLDIKKLIEEKKYKKIEKYIRRIKEYYIGKWRHIYCEKDFKLSDIAYGDLINLKILEVSIKKKGMES